MAVNYGRAFKGKSDKLFSLLIRSLGYCQNCGSTSYLQTAHIISRKYSATRCDLDNAFCLCAGCHRKFHDFPVAFSHFVTDKLGSEKYDALNFKAQQPTKMDWQEEYERLRLIAEELGVSR